MNLYSNILIESAQETANRSIKELGHPRFEHLSAAAFQRGSMPDLEDAIMIGRYKR
jgi:hypothetical protein